ncbi:MAG TPA: hypothetical protein VK395_35540 [Gemmataceae bacterium]|nr:hypothetical protein [Gemmataceae bacterium]
MRQRRHKLQVSTFPFLAVLLCAMGSLILLLLVLDRRARVVAHAKALQEAAQASAVETSAAAHRAELERREHSLHQTFLNQDQETREQVKVLEERVNTAVENIEEERSNDRQLQEMLGKERSRLAGWEQLLKNRRQKISQSDQKTQLSQAEMARLSADLERMERTLEDLKALRRRQRQTYSVVPYRGKHGFARKPLYVECTADELVFYPGRIAIRALGLEPQEVHAEIDRRLARRAAATGKRPESAYLLLLVRPDGITTYYRTVEALKTLEVDFGYEFIDRDWALDFPEDDSTTSSQPWMVAQKNEIPAAGNSVTRKVQGLPASGTSEIRDRPRGITFGGDDSGVRSGAGFEGGSSTGPTGSFSGSGPVRFGQLAAPVGNGSSQPGQPGLSSTATEMPGRPGGSASAPSMFGTASGSPTFGTGIPGRDGATPGSPSLLRAGNPASVMPGTNFRLGGAQAPITGGLAGGNAPAAGIGGMGGAGPYPSAQGSVASAAGMLGGPAGGRTGLSAGNGRTNGTGPNAGTEGGVAPATGGVANGTGGSQTSNGGTADLGMPTAVPSSVSNSSPASAQNNGESSPLLQRVGTNSSNGTPGNGAATNPEAGSSREGGQPRQEELGPASLLPGPVPSSGTGQGQGPINGQSGAGDGGTGTGTGQGQGSSGGQPGTGGAGSGGGRRSQQGGAEQDGGFAPSSGLYQDPLSGIGPRVPDKRITRPTTFRGMQLTGNRDWIIAIECAGDYAVLNLTAQRFPVATLAHPESGHNPLADAVQQAIARRQATVREGVEPYRPMIRFRVRPDGLRAYYLAYPALEVLHVPMMRENLDPPEDSKAGGLVH